MYEEDSSLHLINCSGGDSDLFARLEFPFQQGSKLCRSILKASFRLIIGLLQTNILRPADVNFQGLVHVYLGLFQ